MVMRCPFVVSGIGLASTSAKTLSSCRLSPNSLMRATSFFPRSLCWRLPAGFPSFPASPFRGLAPNSNPRPAASVMRGESPNEGESDRCCSCMAAHPDAAPFVCAERDAKIWPGDATEASPRDPGDDAAPHELESLGRSHRLSLLVRRLRATRITLSGAAEGCSPAFFLPALAFAPGSRSRSLATGSADARVRTSRGWAVSIAVRRQALPPVHARNDRSPSGPACLASSALHLATASEPLGDKPPRHDVVEHAAGVASRRVDSPILALNGEDLRGDATVDATAARPEGPAVDGELAGPRLATNPRHDDSCCVAQPLIVCAEPPLSNYLRRVIRSHRAIERFSLLS